MRSLIRNEYFWLALMIAGMSALATVTIVDRLPFSKFLAKEISAEQFRAQFNFDKSDNYRYIGSDDDFHYLRHNGSSLRHWLKIRKSDLEFEPHEFRLEEEKEMRLTWDVLDHLSLPGS